MLSFSELQKIILSEQELSVMDKILLGLNRLAILNMRDKDRNRFMKKFFERQNKDPITS